ncbi:hypothetical protein [Burkholderia gladioli]|uniref:hypothetical protein n=1 Tax=Burkholderia gladioli TaxID=28095 RepID=UPI0016402882|nr:hypothetical protein [Burkholderia gladioli]
MTNFPRHIEDKHCFVQCPPDRCNCRRGNPVEWALQQERLELSPDEGIAIANPLDGADAAGQPSSMVHALLNVVLCVDKDRAIALARNFLIKEGFLDEAGEPTAKAWEPETAVRHDARLALPSDAG